MNEIKEFFKSIFYTLGILGAIALIIIMGGFIAQLITKYVSINTLGLVCIFVVIVIIVHLLRKLK